MASEQEINKRLRSLHQDFDFLLDNNVISTELYDNLVQQIPRRYNAAKSAGAGATATAPAPSNPASPQPSVTTLGSQLQSTTLTPTSEKSQPVPPPDTSPPPPQAPPPAYGLAQAEALYDYSSNDEGDLPLIAGQRITILEYDWWRGEGQNGQQGIFPANYVRKIEAPVHEKGGFGQEKGGYGPPGYQAYPPPPQQYPGAMYQPAPYQPGPYQQPPPQQPPPQEHKESRFGKFGKEYGKTFVNATAWGGGMTLGADVINKIF